MTTKLSERSYAFAQEQIRKGRVVLDQRTDWSEHQPSTRQENEFIETHLWDEYASWHLGLLRDIMSTPGRSCAASHVGKLLTVDPQ
ncbi:MAG: hypothetical protein ACLQK8_13600 [Streptosporangiaceae bacterium]